MMQRLFYQMLLLVVLLCAANFAVASAPLTLGSVSVKIFLNYNNMNRAL